MSDTPVKVVIDCSATGAPDPALADELHKAAVDILANAGSNPGDMELALVRAGQLMQDANAVLSAAAVVSDTLVPLDQDELAQRDADQAAHAAQQDVDRARGLGTLRAQRDRYLAQTDVLTLPDAALPVDMPQQTKDAITANRDAWVKWRQQLRDYMATVTDPFDPPPFPTQPASPVLVLT